MSFLARIARRLAGPGPDDLPIYSDQGLALLPGVDQYGSAVPFPHMQVDGVFNPDYLRAILKEWPQEGQTKLEAHNDGTFVRKKHNTTWETQFGPYTRRFFAEMASPRMLLALERMTGISGLMPDPYLFGGGLHFTQAGGTLAVHADFNRLPKLNVDRRLNLLIYLNEGWTEANQGWLELWDRKMEKCEARVLPVFNRMAVFSTTSFSFHGQPEPIVGPPDLFRRSIALYYYTNGRPAEEISEEEHSTLWQERPQQGY
jgi:hypothetical protein